MIRLGRLQRFKQPDLAPACLALPQSDSCNPTEQPQRNCMATVVEYVESASSVVAASTCSSECTRMHIRFRTAEIEAPSNR